MKNIVVGNLSFGTDALNMKTLSILRRAPIAVFALIPILLAPQTSSGQICSGSHLTYIVRDAHGAVLNAGDNSLKFEPDNGSGRTWRIVSDWQKDWFGKDGLKLPDSIKTSDSKACVLMTDGMCTLRKPVELHLTLKRCDHESSLVAHALRDTDSREYLVDALPFHAGNFEIDLPVDQSGHSSSLFYPATAWKKISDK